MYYTYKSFDLQLTSSKLADELALFMYNFFLGVGYV